MKSVAKSESCHGLDNADPCRLLGPYPVTTVVVLADLGMTDREIALYFRVRPDDLAHIRQGKVPELQFVYAGKRAKGFDLDQG